MILRNWKKIDPKILKRRGSHSFLTKIWSQYKCGNQETWLLSGARNCNTILQLDLFFHFLRSKLHGTESEPGSEGPIQMCCCNLIFHPLLSPSPSPSDLSIMTFLQSKAWKKLSEHSKESSSIFSCLSQWELVGWRDRQVGKNQASQTLVSSFILSKELVRLRLIKLRSN